jgi:hypothetical protein
MLSICMPSNRLLKKSKYSIESISQLSNLYEIESVIFDNSFDMEKSNYIESQSLNIIYNKNSPIGVADNWLACMSAASREFILMVGDDDRLCLLSDPQDYLQNLQDSDVGVRPIFIPFSGTQGVLSVESFSTDAETAKDRVKQYFSMNNGKNLSFYSIYRKAIFVDLMREFYDSHPTKAGFADWPLALALISMGKIKSNKNIIFYYNMDNWSSNEVIVSSNEGIYKSAGLPLDSMCIQSAFTALDVFALIARKKSPISTTEKYDASIFAMSTYYSGLIDVLKSNHNPDIDGKVKLALDLIKGDYLSASQKIINLLTVVETWVPGLAKKYQDYFAQTVDPVILETIG